jgi:beta-phosphoglucomutase
MEPACCVVFEDTPTGIQAAHNGGMKAIGVATSHPARSLALADLVVRGLDEVSLMRLRSLVDSESCCVEQGPQEWSDDDLG